MRTQKIAVIFCLIGASLCLVFAQNADTDAQEKARRALQDKLNELNAPKGAPAVAPKSSAAPVTPIPADTDAQMKAEEALRKLENDLKNASAPAPKTVEKKVPPTRVREAQKSTAPEKAAPTVTPVPQDTAAQRQAEEALKKMQADLNRGPVPAKSDAAAQARAQEELRRKQAELDAQQRKAQAAEAKKAPVKTVATPGASPTVTPIPSDTAAQRQAEEAIRKMNAEAKNPQAPIASDAAAQARAREELRKRQAEMDAQQRRAREMEAKAKASERATVPVVKPAQDTAAQRQAEEALRKLEAELKTAPPKSVAETKADEKARAKEAARMERDRPKITFTPTTTQDTPEQMKARDALRSIQTPPVAPVKPAPKVAVETPKKTAPEKTVAAETKKKEEADKNTPAMEAAKKAREAEVAAAKAKADWQTAKIAAEEADRKGREAEAAARRAAALQTVSTKKTEATAKVSNKKSTDATKVMASKSPSTKQEKLDELLQRYKVDEITPREYHEQRAKILAEP